MKKCKKLIFLIFIIIISIIMYFQIVFASDVIYEICNSCGTQEALLVGEIVEIAPDKERAIVEVVRLVSGTLKYKKNRINVQFNKLEGINVGEEVLLSLEIVNLNEFLYKITYECACYFVQCEDNKKIKSLSTIYDYDEENSVDSLDIILQWYCNTGEILSEDDLSDTTKYYRWVGEKKN